MGSRGKGRGGLLGWGPGWGGCRDWEGWKVADERLELDGDNEKVSCVFVEINGDIGTFLLVC